MKLNISIDTLTTLEGIGNGSLMHIFSKTKDGEYLNTSYCNSERLKRDYYNSSTLVSSFEDLIKSFIDEGKRVFLVALMVGGLMECPNFSYDDFYVVVAKDEEEAREIYNKVTKTNFFYGSVVGELSL